MTPRSHHCLTQLQPLALSSLMMMPTQHQPCLQRFLVQLLTRARHHQPQQLIPLSSLLPHQRSQPLLLLTHLMALHSQPLLLLMMLLLT